MSLTLLVGSPTDTHNYILKSRMTIYNTSVLRYPEHSNSIKDVVKEVYHFLSNNRYGRKYILTESIYVIGYLTLLQKANNLLDKGVGLNNILHSMENFVKINSNDFKAFELNGTECKDLIVTYGNDKLRLISDENYPNAMRKQILFGYNMLLKVEDDWMDANEVTLEENGVV